MQAQLAHGTATLEQAYATLVHAVSRSLQAVSRMDDGDSRVAAKLISRQRQFLLIVRGVIRQDMRRIGDIVNSGAALDRRDEIVDHAREARFKIATSAKSVEKARRALVEEFDLKSSN